MSSSHRRAITEIKLISLWDTDASQRVASCVLDHEIVLILKVWPWCESKLNGKTEELCREARLRTTGQTSSSFVHDDLGCDESEGQESPCISIVHRFAPLEAEVQSRG